MVLFDIGFFVVPSVFLCMQVSKEAGRDYSETINALFIETSALTALNVDEMFIKIGKCFCNHPFLVNNFLSYFDH